MLLAPAPRVRADFFSSRTAFNAASPALTIQTFENLIGTPQYPSNNPPDNTISYTNSPQGLSFNGIRVVGLGDYGYETYLVGPNFPGDGTYSVNGSGSIILGRRFSDFYLPAGITAFGVDYCLDKYWLGPNPVGALTVTVEMADGFTQSTVIAALGTAQFIGVTAVAGHGGISHFQLDSHGLGLYPYTMVDNMTFNVAAVPEPATWWTGAGLALGLGGIVWRRVGVRRSRVIPT